VVFLITLAQALKTILLAGLSLEESFEGIKGMLRKALLWRRSSKLSYTSSPFSQLSPKVGETSINESQGKKKHFSRAKLYLYLPDPHPSTSR